MVAVYVAQSHCWLLFVTHLVTFSDESMSRARELCVESAMSFSVEKCASFSPGSISDWPEVRLHAQIFRQPKDPRRAWGWWAWKPAIIRSELEWISDNSILIYADAGVEFINNVNHIIDRMDQDVFLFGNNWEHAHWCKRDVVDAIFSKETLPEYTYWTLPVEWGIFGKQVQASVLFFRVSDYTRKFVAEWLHWCLASTYKRVNNGPLERHGYLIDDSPSHTPNHPEFREHRHDQAILTTLAYREGIKLHYWPAMYNDGAFSYEKLPCYAGDDYPILFHHHRRRNHEWQTAA